MLQQLLQIKKIKKPFSCLPLILGLFIAQVNAHIAPDKGVESLYQVSAFIPEHKQNEKELFFQNGLRTVLQRITGTQMVLENQNIWTALEAPMPYVQQFSEQGDQLVIQFSESLVDSLVLQNGFTVWGQNRPTLILWLGVAKENQRQIIGAESHPDLYKTLEQFASARGLQLVLPLMDLIDMDQVMVSDLWGQFPSVMTMASERYGANAILIGRMSKEETGWEGRWELLMNNQPSYHTVSVAGFEHALMKGLSFAITQLQTQFAVNKLTAQPQSLFIDMRGIYSASELNAAEAYLNGLDQLKEVSIKEIVSNRVVFEITPQGHIDKNILSQVINMDKNFAKVPVFEENKNELTLTYRWAPE